MKRFITSLCWTAAFAATAAFAQVPAAVPKNESPSVADAAAPVDKDAKTKAERREAHRRIRIVHRHRIK